MEEAIKCLKNGGVGVIPTDTLYGLVGSAYSPKAVERIYELRQRDKDKPCIILISSIDDLEKFGVHLTLPLRDRLEKFWPGKVSIVFPVANEKFSYLHRGGKSLAFRFPNDKDLIAILKETGPLVAPSANIQSFSPAKTIEDAERYFSTKVDFYQDGGEMGSLPSKLISFGENGEEIILRG